MKIISSARTDAGKSRDSNEDDFLVDDDIGLYVVCDGMGGHEGGEIASAYAVQKLQEYVYRHKDRVIAFHDQDVDTPDSVLIAFIEDAIRSVSESVYDLANENPTLHEMGTTLTALLIFGERAVLGHVGDSRCYMIRDKKSLQLTDDHTVVSKLVQRGIVTKEAACKHQFRHVLSQSIGSEKPLHIDTLLFDVYVNDRFVVCSDGLADYLEERDRDIKDFISKNSPDKIVQDLIEFANSSGGKDNITVLVLQVCID